ncbi:c-type cytochrome [Halomonas campisalis]|uniref:C-type cytochrome n=1 Tax=Billgrantia campisalis TaxID=74661 RepID=A0ABS9PD01_9GAMM|nr:cytochrome c peroxidase [Halomonas campisalis]MCG6659642.1 c-type cytochrome [Halomonas campisalis]MDR5864597.1 cytochrome c peroxidase [Halomonas campisalis]
MTYNALTRPAQLAAAVSLGAALAFSGSVLAGDGFGEYRDRFEPLPHFPPIPADNSLTPEKVELGNMLFFEPRISSSGVISCATCHNPALGWADRIPRATGHDGQIGERNTPTVLNSGFLEAQFWDGREPDLEGQALGPIEADIEMAMDLDMALERLEEFDLYQQKFAAAYPDDDAPINADNLAKALASFQRTLNTPNSPFDRYLRGDIQALDEQEKRGMVAFVDNGCIACHSGPALTDSNFWAIQVPGSTDVGRYEVTGDEDDMYKFRTPTLRNVGVTYPYMNNGATETLEEAVAIMGTEMLGRDFEDDTIADITAFLHTLTGEMPHFEVPALP